jgi:hypothetical protein
MLGGMVRFASLILVGATALTAWGAPAPKPQGRVVRVERPHGDTNTVPILCELKADGSGMCVGASPNIGDTVIVVDDTHTLAEVRITRSAPQSPKCDTLWTVNGDIIRGDMSQSRGTKAIGIIDPATDRRSARRVEEDKLISPNPSPDVRVALGVDRDGDGTADIIVTQYACDAQGQPTSTGSAIDFCIDIWCKRDKVMKRAWTTKLATCR